MGGVARSLLLGLTLALAAALPAAAANWVGPTVLSAPGATIAPSPSVAINDAGSGVAAWAEASGTGTVIRVSTHAPGAAWTTEPAPVSGATGPLSCTPHASLDAAGNALIVWAAWSAAGCTGTQTILFATKPAGATAWSQPTPIANGTPSDPGDTMTASSNAAGQTVVGWETHPSINSHIVFGSFGSPTTGFGAPVALTAVVASDVPDLLSAGVGPSGDAAVQWNLLHSGLSNVQMAVKPRGALFTANTPTDVTNLSDPMSAATHNSVALDAAGDVLSAYYFSPNGNPPVFASTFTPAGGTPGAQQVVGTPQPGFVAATIDVGFDGAGNATAAWVETNLMGDPPNYPSRLFTASRGPGAAAIWAGNAPLTGIATSPEPNVHIAVATSGAAVVSWDAVGAENDAIAIYRPAGGVFGSAANLGQGAATPANLSPIFSPQAAIAPGGDALVGFDGSVSNDARVAVLDAHPPAITALTVPATANAGTSVAMTGGGADVWTGVADAQLTWNFGDGTTGAGGSVAHVYAKAGTYTVTFVASDGAGNASVPATRQIVIAGAPGGGGPTGPTGTLPATSVAKPKLKAAYVASRLVGTVALRGTSAAAAPLQIQIRRSGAKKVAVTLHLTVKPGTWSKTVKLPATLVPGRYGVAVSGKGVSASSASFTIAAPKSGIANRVYASGPRHGPAATRLVGTSELWAHFHFGTLPKKGQAITTQWILPNGSKLGANSRPRTSLVEAQVKDLKGGTLPTGRWRCVLRVGGAVVATLNVRLS